MVNSVLKTDNIKYQLDMFENKYWAYISCLKHHKYGKSDSILKPFFAKYFK